MTSREGAWLRLPCLFALSMGVASGAAARAAAQPDRATQCLRNHGAGLGPTVKALRDLRGKLDELQTEVNTAQEDIRRALLQGAPASELHRAERTAEIVDRAMTGLISLQELVKRRHRELTKRRVDCMRVAPKQLPAVAERHSSARRSPSASASLRSFILSRS